MTVLSILATIATVIVGIGLIIGVALLILGVAGVTIWTLLKVGLCLAPIALGIGLAKVFFM